MTNHLYNNLNGKKFMKITTPAILAMVFLSLYTIVDGVFISRFVGENALAALNIVTPLYSLIFGMGIMLAAGSSAIVSAKLGEGRIEEAKEKFTLMIGTAFLAGIVFGIGGVIFSKKIVLALGATPALFQYCIDYFWVISLFMPIMMLKTMFEYFLRAAGHPSFELFNSIIGGVTNIVLDYVFIVVLEMGIAGAAWGTALGYAISFVISGLFFLSKKPILHFKKPKWDSGFLLSSCANGSSEMVSELSNGVTTYLFNILTLAYMGEKGVAAISIILYAHFLMTSVYIGFSSGASPIISYFYGKKEEKEIKKAVSYCVVFIVISSVLVFAFSQVGASFMVEIFADKHTEVFEITKQGFHLFSYCFLFVGINIFASALFTSFLNGKISAILSFFRALVFVLIGILFLPELFGINGIWLIIPFAEIMTLLFSVYYARKYKKVYGY